MAGKVESETLTIRQLRRRWKPHKERLTPSTTLVHLDRARSPAPSWATLSWLETSIRAYSKFVDVVARSLKDEVDEEANTRRERMAIEKMRELLAEMQAE